jgi:choice-of-anchor B domain-containing protein
MRKFFVILVLLIPCVVAAQTTLDTLRHLNIKPGGGYSAVWGYTAPNGREYALIGCNGSGGQQAGTSFVDITDIANIRQAGFTPGPASSWREMKTYRQYAYIVTEASGSGTQIVDLSYLPDSVHLVRTFVYTQSTNNTAKSHTITISDGFMYLNGCASWSPGGIVIFDLHTDPTNPTFVGTYEPEYIHDSYVLRDTIYGSAVYSGGGIHIANARNKASIQEIGKITYTGSGTHNAWVTKDRGFVISTDEIGSTPKTLKFWDISNLPTIPTTVTTTYTPSPSDIVHNITIRGDYAYVAWYTLGAVVVNISDPVNPTYAGGYDTSTQPPGGYNGMWGIYPYYPSGKIIGGDMQNGLWVFRFSDLAARVPVTLLAPAMNETTAVASPVTFRWTRTADLSKDPHWYEVRLTGTGIDTTWRANDSVAAFSDLARLQSGRQYTWYVTVRDEFNTTQSAQTFQFYYGTPTVVASVTVTAPNGGENWQYNTVQNVTWTSTLVDSVNISYKTSSSGSWVTIASNRPAAAGSYSWTIPNAATTQARVRVVSSTNGTVLDSSNNVFSILVPGMAANPSSLNFGNVNINQSRRDTIRITNGGTATLTISNITSDSAAFTVSRSSFTIPAGGSDTVSVFFRPTQVRPYTSTLWINGNAPTSSIGIGLSGVGQNPNSVDESDVPTTYALSQNYPNPFNPTTLIRYQIPAAAHVMMRLYNLIGQQVAELVNETQAVGRYQVTLDASSLPSGIYFYRITAGSFTETKKLTLLR